MLAVKRSQTQWLRVPGTLVGRTTSAKPSASVHHQQQALLSHAIAATAVSSSLLLSQTRSSSLSPQLSPAVRLQSRSFAAAAAVPSGAPLPSPSDYVDYDFQTLHELIEKACQYYPTHNIFGTRKGDKYEYLTYADFHRLYSTTRTMLATEYGIRENDKVAIISNNRIEWAALMYATVSLGAQWVPM